MIDWLIDCRMAMRAGERLFHMLHIFSPNAWNTRTGPGWSQEPRTNLEGPCNWQWPMPLDHHHCIPGSALAGSRNTTHSQDSNTGPLLGDTRVKPRHDLWLMPVPGSPLLPILFTVIICSVFLPNNHIRHTKPLRMPWRWAFSHMTVWGPSYFEAVRLLFFKYHEWFKPCCKKDKCQINSQRKY